jgi:predicted nucleic acid-binding Zn ribbon protein
MPEDELDESEYPDEADMDEEGDETDPCPACGKPIYEDSIRCPHCGEYVHLEHAPSPQATWFWIALLLALVIVLLWSFWR